MSTRGATSLPRSGRALAAGIAAALALLAGRTASAAPGPIVIMPASGHGVSAPLVQHARWLLLQSLSTSLRAQLVDYDRAPIAERLEPWRLASIAASVGGGVALAVDVSRTAGITTVEVACFDAVTAGIVCRARESTAAGPETLATVTDAVTARLTQTLGGARETPPTAQPATHRFRFGARSLVAVPTDTAGGGALAMGGFGLVVTANLSGAFIDLDAEFEAGGGRDMRSIGAGFFSVLGDGRHAPFAGGSVHWVGQDLGGRGSSGAQVRPTVGFAWGRDQIMQTRVELGYFVNLFKERTLDRLIEGSDRTSLSHGPMLSLGAAF